MIIEGSGQPVVLFHGVTCSAGVWHRVIPMLSDRYQVIAPTALGHRGGNRAAPGAGIVDVIDDAERMLDKLQLDQPHLAGNSMGGWVAIELARRGRASSVCALSPAGFWDVASSGHRHATNKLKQVVALSKATRWALPVVSRVGFVRTLGMRDNAVNGARLTPDEFIAMADDLLGCTSKYDFLNTQDEIAPMASLPCPVMLAWSQRDRIFPVEVNGKIAKQRMSGAEWRILPDVGHVPMIDDPALVASTIIDSVNQSKGRS